VAHGGGSFFGGVEQTIAEVCFLATPAERDSRERLLPQLVTPELLRVPPIRNDSEMSDKDKEGESCCHFGLPALAVSAVVPSFVGNGNGHSESVQLTPDPPSFELPRATPTHSIEKIPPCRMEIIRGRLEKRGLSPSVIRLLLASSRGSTLSTYQSAWNGWYRWCMAGNQDPLSNDLNTILQYLTHLFDSGLASQTINLHRSMLSMTLEPVNGINIGEHPLVVQLLKGCYNSLPPRPRYNNMWNPDDVLKFISSLPDNSVLSLSVISYKLVTLTALSSLLRVSEIASISRTSIHCSASAAIFSLSRPRKTQHDGPLQSISLPRLSGRICPVDCLENYLGRSKSLCPSSDSLFISLKKPYRAVGSSTIARWIKKCLSDAGIDDSFSAHSTRGSGASKAAKIGIPIEQILKAASWTKESTINRFYNRPLTSASVASSILTQTD